MVRDAPNPSGLCFCGCGQATPIATKTSAQWGHVKGQPTRYVRGHHPGHRGHAPGWTVLDTPCWIWTGRIRPDDGRPMWSDELAYRRVYEEQVRPLSDDEVLHHVCHNRICVNPSHLEPLVDAEHARQHQANMTR
jgi:hypothetical protein